MHSVDHCFSHGLCGTRWISFGVGHPEGLFKYLMPYCTLSLLPGRSVPGFGLLCTVLTTELQAKSQNAISL